MAPAGGHSMEVSVSTDACRGGTRRTTCTGPLLFGHCVGGGGAQHTRPQTGPDSTRLDMEVNDI